MPIEIPTLNLVALAPQLILVITAILVMAFDIFVDDKRVMGYVSLLGLAVAAVVCVGLLGRPAQAIQDMAVSDGYSLILNLIFIVTAALSILIALSYLSDKGMQRGEYYTLLLFSTAGMMLMGAATDLIVIFLGLEIMSIALYILAAFNRRQMASGEAGLTEIRSIKVKSRRIKECFAQFECRLYKTTRVGDHLLFVGKVVTAWQALPWLSC